MKLRLPPAGVLLSILIAGHACADVFNMPAGQTSLAFVTIRDAGNAPDPLNAASIPGIGSVPYRFRIGKYDVTNAQYADFLNHVAASDPNMLFKPDMANYFSTSYVTRSGAPGSYTYGTIPATENYPVAWVSWYDAARFCNWLHNGQGNGSTESGAYTLTGPTSIAGGRATDARYFIPTENEWYKAAYGSPLGTYTLYATNSNAIAGNVAPNGANCYFNGTYVGTGGPNWSINVNPYTSVGAYSNSASAFGTFDQNGNVFQWTETAVFDGAQRRMRGGCWINGDLGLRSYYTDQHPPEYGNDGGIGFRIATVPLPCPADFNGDDVVEGPDFVAFASAYDLFFCSDPAMPGNCAADFNGDSVVDDSDFVLFAEAYDVFYCP